MSGTRWEYYVRYRSDIDAALQALRQEVFERELYRDPWTGDAPHSDEVLLSPEIRQWLKITKRAEGEEQTPCFACTPSTIPELRELAEEHGTHSILDIDHVAPVSEFEALFPLSETQLTDLFGTTRPTRADLDRWRHRAPSDEEPPLYRHWEGISIVIYKDDIPDELYFQGASGD